MPYSLPSIFRLNPDEVILLFDRCTDNSLELTYEITKRLNFVDRTKILLVDEKSDYRERIAYLRRLGFGIAKNDIILNTDADVVLDERIARYISEINGTKLIVFERIDYPSTYQCVITRILQRLPIKRLYHKFSGLYVFSKKAWLQTEDLEDLKGCEIAEDTHLDLAISKKFSRVFILSRSYHLRPVETRERHYRRGRAYWNVAHRPLFLTLMSAILLLRPALIVGYIHERFGRADKD